jgi:ribosomal 30S subunit maturation factor RimM
MQSIGNVVSVNPARRELRIILDPGWHEALEHRKWLNLDADGALFRCRVASVRSAGKRLIVRLSAGIARDTVARMKGASVLMEETAGRLEDAYSLAELAGMTVVDRQERLVGTVKDAYTGRAHSLLEIEGTDGRLMLAPLVDELVVEVDVSRGRLVVSDLARFAVEQ